MKRFDFRLAIGGVLILMGGLLLLQQMGIISGDISVIWASLLIAAGVVFLAVFAAKPPALVGADSWSDIGRRGHHPIPTGGIYLPRRLDHAWRGGAELLSDIHFPSRALVGDHPRWCVDDAGI